MTALKSLSAYRAYRPKRKPLRVLYGLVMIPVVALVSLAGVTLALVATSELFMHWGLATQAALVPVLLFASGLHQFFHQLFNPTTHQLLGVIIILLFPIAMASNQKAPDR
jgi:hypothetical protein